MKNNEELRMKNEKAKTQYTCRFYFLTITF